MIIHSNKSGNVLFLILIAVALFAALSYAVVQSSRSGSGTSSEEGTLVTTAELVQYPVGVKTAVLRMMIGGVDVSDLEFNSPSVFGSCTSTSVCVFHPSGGGATHVNPNPDYTPSTIQANPLSIYEYGHMWTFSAHHEVENIGTSVTNDFGGNEVIAFLVGIQQSLCEKINEKLGITAMASFDSAAMAEDMIDSGSGAYMDHNYSPPASEDIIGPSNPNILSNGSALLGQPEGCYYEDDGGVYVYYHVLVER